MDTSKLIEAFFILLVCVSAIHATLSCTTTILYRKKPRGRLTHNQLKVVQGDANVGQRSELFFYTLFSNFLSPSIYFFTLALTLGFYLYSNF